MKRHFSKIISSIKGSIEDNMEIKRGVGLKEKEEDTGAVVRIK